MTSGLRGNLGVERINNRDDSTLKFMCWSFAGILKFLQRGKNSYITRRYRYLYNFTDVRLMAFR